MHKLPMVGFIHGISHPQSGVLPPDYCNSSMTVACHSPTGWLSKLLLTCVEKRVDIFPLSICDEAWFTCTSSVRVTVSDWNLKHDDECIYMYDVALKWVGTHSEMATLAVKHYGHLSTRNSSLLLQWHQTCPQLQQTCWSFFWTNENWLLSEFSCTICKEQSYLKKHSLQPAT